MKNYTTFAETEALLKIAINLKGRSTKEVAAKSGIRAGTLYKWKTSDVRLSPDKADDLLLYFLENEPKRLEHAEFMRSALFQNNI